MCPHTTIYTAVTDIYVDTLCPHTTPYVSSYCYICVLNSSMWTQYTHSVSAVYIHTLCVYCVHILLYTYCVHILLYSSMTHMCPHTTTYVSSYYYMCVLILLYLPLSRVCVMVTAPEYIYIYIRTYIYIYIYIYRYVRI